MSHLCVTYNYSLTLWNWFRRHHSSYGMKLWWAMCTKLTVDCFLWDIMKIDKPFGGIAVVFGGDPHQILPVVCHGNQCKIVQACIHSSSLWEEIQQLKLTIKMRLKPDEIDFANYLLQLGNGTTPVHPEIGKDMVKVPNEYLVHSTDKLIDKVFPQMVRDQIRIYSQISIYSKKVSYL